MKRSPDELLAYDRGHVWHPYTSMTDPTPVRLVTGASGVRLRLADGTELVDGMSSWWAAIHGYAVPELDAAANCSSTSRPPVSSTSSWPTPDR